MWYGECRADRLPGSIRGAGVKQATYTGIAWTPVVVVILLLVLALYAGVGQLEAVTDGTSYVVPQP